MPNKENEKLTNSYEGGNSRKINDEGRRILETSANALNRGNPESKMDFGKFNTNKGEIIIPNNKEELELMQACKNCDLEKVKSLVEANKYNNNILKKAQSIAKDILRLEIVDYLQREMAKNDLDKILPKKDPTDL